MFGLWYQNGDGTANLCECDGGYYYESAFDNLSDAMKYADSVNAAHTEMGYATSGTCPYFAAPLPAGVLLPE